MASFPLLKLHHELQEEVIRKIDALGVSRMRSCNKYLKQLLSGPQFVMRRNEGKDKVSSGCYAFTHIVEGSAAAPFGTVHGLRWDREVKSFLTMNVDCLLENYVAPGDLLTLLFCCRSHFLFLRVRDPEPLVLLAVNFTNRRVRLIACPHPMVASHFTDDPRNLNMMVFSIEMELHFKIVHVLIDELALDVPPRLSVFYSRLDSGRGGWIMVQQLAHTAPHEGVKLDLFNEHLMILPRGDEEVLFVTWQGKAPLYLSSHIDDLFENTFEFPANAINVRRNWILRPIKHFAPANQGWAAVITTHNQGPISIIKDVSLFIFNPFLFTYEQMCSIEDHFLDEEERLAITTVLCEATDHSVQVGLVVSHGQHIWSIKWFVYHIASRKWRVRDTPNMDATRVGLPRLTSRLTI